jgi:Putative Flp pilus-assembly TadE/G-like
MRKTSDAAHTRIPASIHRGIGTDNEMNSRPRLPGRVHDGERGQIIVIFVLGLVVLVAMTGLVIDGGNAFLQRRDSQNVSDLASMAGTTAIVGFYVKDGGTPAAATTDGAKVYNAITTSVAANGCHAAGATPCSWTAQYVDHTLTPLGTVTAAGAIPSGAQGVVVNASSQPRTYFLGVIGQSTWDIGTTATTVSSSPNSVAGGQLLPIGFNPPTNLTIGQTYNITDTTNGPGNFGWLSWTGDNATGVLAASLCRPNNPAMTFPVDIPGEPGIHNSSGVRGCLQGWVDSGATVLLPIWDSCSPCNGNNASYHVIGLAAFVLTSFTQPAIDQIRGHFVGYYGLPSIGSDYGAPPCQYNGGTCMSTTSFIGLAR